MELTPPATHSPASPFRFQQHAPPPPPPQSSTPQPQHASVYEYPSPAHSDSRYHRADSTSQGLGLYPCSLPENPASEATAVLHTPESQSWSAHHAGPDRRASHAAPNILSAEYDPFAPYHHDIYAPQTATASPLVSSAASQSSSMSSAPASEIYTQPSSVASYTPRMDLEPKPEYSMMASPQTSHALLASQSGAYTGPLDGAFYPEPSPLSAWHGAPADLPPFSALPLPAYRRASAQEPMTSTPEPPPTMVRRATTSVPRTRQPRRLTTKEDANFQCQIKGCGKLFGRSYNFKAHMETHDDNREYPFPCPLKDCTKKFVRKTDLQRHHQSVHMKQRNFRCDYCSRFFARKDTLRRHMEDGCSKRFDIETVDFRPAAYPADPQAGPIRVLSTEPTRAASFASMSYSPAPHEGMPMPSPYLERPAYISEPGHAVWSH